MENTTVARLYIFFTIGIPGVEMFLCFDGKLYLHLAYNSHASKNIDCWFFFFFEKNLLVF